MRFRVRMTVGGLRLELGLGIEVGLGLEQNVCTLVEVYTGLGFV